MRFATIKEAKSVLYELVEEAEAGGDVVLLRGATPVAALVRVDARDFELSDRFTNDQAARVLRELAMNRGLGLQTFDSEERAARWVREQSRRRPKSRGA